VAPAVGKQKSRLRLKGGSVKEFSLFGLEDYATIGVTGQKK